MAESKDILDYITEYHTTFIDQKHEIKETIIQLIEQRNQNEEVSERAKITGEDYEDANKHLHEEGEKHHGLAEDIQEAD